MMDGAPQDAIQVWWIFLAATLVALILIGAFVASMIIQQRRFVATTRAFAGRLLLAQEEERAWVARELHDDLIQRVALLGGELEELARGDAHAGPIRLMGLHEELHELAGEIRRIAHRMHPSTLEHLGLPAALEQLAAEFTDQGLPVRVETSVAPAEVPEQARTPLFRIAQESLRNVMRHARADGAVVRLMPEAGGVLLEIADGGNGFDPGSASSAGGLGLTSLRERMRLAQGRLSIRSAPGAGTTISAWAPGESGR